MPSDSPSRFGYRRLAGFLLACALCFACFGCSPKGSVSSSGSSESSSSDSNGTPGPFVTITGNWEFTAKATAGAVPFSVLSGFINEAGTSATESNYVTMAFQVQSSTCYSNSPEISMQGGMMVDGMDLMSFPVDSQTLTAHITKNAAADQMTGTYDIKGGCADGEQGTLTGTLYAPLTGTYSGMISGTGSSKAIQLTLAQDDQGTGDGHFYVTGTAAFTGFPCFSTGTISGENSFVTGSSASLTVVTNEVSGSQLTLHGTFDPAADTLTVASMDVTGGNCAALTGGAVLTLKP